MNNVIKFPPKPVATLEDQIRSNIARLAELHEELRVALEKLDKTIDKQK